MTLGAATPITKKLRPQSDAMLGELDRLFFVHGAAPYSAKLPGLTHLGHGAQAANLARHAGAPPALIVASLLHDIGHMLFLDGAVARPSGPDDLHEEIAANWLASNFDEAITEPVRLHVEAKRYLVAVEPYYAGSLSEASRRSLSAQGGAMTQADAQRFLARPYAVDAVLLRRCDDQAKVASGVSWAWDDFRPLVASFCGHVR